MNAYIGEYAVNNLHVVYKINFTMCLYLLLVSMYACVIFPFSWVWIRLHSGVSSLCETYIVYPIVSVLCGV